MVVPESVYCGKRIKLGTVTEDDDNENGDDDSGSEKPPSAIRHLIFYVYLSTLLPSICSRIGQSRKYQPCITLTRSLSSRLRVITQVKQSALN